MLRTPVILILVILLGVAGGVLFLATWDIPAPVEQVNKIISDDRFP